ncbi:hypothetical protein EON65_12690 [archaeon]|nr:MAG: hypothetical protein EON65_12690 [archaeon]
MNSIDLVSVGIMIEQASSDPARAFMASSSFVYDRAAGKSSLLQCSTQASPIGSKPHFKSRASSNSQHKVQLTPIDICSAVIERRTRCAESDNMDNDRWSREKVAHFVQVQVQKWIKVLPVHPEHFLQRILQCRGYDSNYIKTCPRSEDRYDDL